MKKRYGRTHAVIKQAEVVHMRMARKPCPDDRRVLCHQVNKCCVTAIGPHGCYLLVIQGAVHINTWRNMESYPNFAFTLCALFQRMTYPAKFLAGGVTRRCTAV